MSARIMLADGSHREGVVYYATMTNPYTPLFEHGCKVKFLCLIHKSAGISVLLYSSYDLLVTLPIPVGVSWNVRLFILIGRHSKVH
jgi:hypothetical protein